MARSWIKLATILSRTSNRCHLCGKRWRIEDYGPSGWTIDHSKARARGGSDHANNLFAACAICNSSKGASSTRATRAKYGLRRSPMGGPERARVRERSANRGALVGASAFATLGGLTFGPPGAIVGGLLGAIVGEKHGRSKNPEK